VRFLGLQIVVMVLGLIGTCCLILKKKTGWALGAITILLLILINYLANLYILIIPCVASLALSIVGYVKWKKEEREEK